MNIQKEFEVIRDIPYSIPLSASEENNSCSGKVIKLKKVLDSAGYESRYRVCEFRWSDLSIDKEVLSVLHEDLSTHVYLEVRFGDTWIDVDPTWDFGLSKTFLVNEWQTDGNMVIAVKQLKLYSHEQSKEIMENEDVEENKRDLEKNGKFYGALNRWFEEVRKGKK